MRWSQIFIPTLREDPASVEAASHRLLVRAGFIRQLTTGVYSLLPLGQRVRLKIIEIIRQEMNNIGGQEFLLSALQPLELWEESGRKDAVSDVMFRLQDRKGSELALGLTHEEVFTSIARTSLVSYKQLPQTWYQIQTKFRDEARPRGGLLRVREFTMKDAYSFDLDDIGLDQSFQRHHDAYVRIFNRCGVNFRTVEASSGAMGGSTSVEFMVLTQAGEDTLVLCSQCSYAANLEKAGSTEKCINCGGMLKQTRGLEIGHIFKLGTYYSEKMNAKVLGPQGTRQPMVMGCYGIGVERLLAAIAELWHDDKGLYWPVSVAPFAVVIVPINAQDSEQFAIAEQIYVQLKEHGIDCLLDDRDERAGIKFNDADLIGVPFRITVGKKTGDGQVELFNRVDGTIVDIEINEVRNILQLRGVHSK